MHDAPPHADDHTTAGATSQGGSSALAGISASAWSSLDAVDLAAEFGTPVPTMQSVPVFLRSGVRQAFVLAPPMMRPRVSGVDTWPAPTCGGAKSPVRELC